MSLWWFDRVGVIRTDAVDIRTDDGLDSLITLFFYLTRLSRRGWGFVFVAEIRKTPTVDRPPRRRSPRLAAVPRPVSAADLSSLTDAGDASRDINLSVVQEQRTEAVNKSKSKHDRKGNWGAEADAVNKARFRRTNPFYGWTIDFNRCAVNVGESIYRQYGLFSRGVFVAEGQMVDNTNALQEVVVKFSWQPSKNQGEKGLVNRAWQEAVDSEDPEMCRRLPHIHEDEVWYSTNKGFRGDLETRNVLHANVKHRVLRVLVAEKLDRLATISNADHLRKVVQDVALCKLDFLIL